MNQAEEPSDSEGSIVENTEYQALFPPGFGNDSGNTSRTDSPDPDDMAQARNIVPTENSINNDGKLVLGGRTPLLDPLSISAITSNFGPYRQLILTSISDEWFKTPLVAYDDTIVHAASAFCLARLEQLNASEGTRHAILLTGELAAPFLPASSYMSERDANQAFTDVMRYMIRFMGIPELFEGFEPVKYAALPEAELNGLPVRFPCTDVEAAALSFAQALRLLRIFCKWCSKVTAAQMGLQVISNLKKLRM